MLRISIRVSFGFLFDASDVHSGSFGFLIYASDFRSGLIRISLGLDVTQELPGVAYGVTPPASEGPEFPHVL